MARPPKPPGDKQAHLVLLRLTAAEKRLLLRAAKRVGLPAATYSRKIVLVQASKELR